MRTLWHNSGVFEKGGHKLIAECLGKMNVFDGAGGCGGKAFTKGDEGLNSEKINFVRICEALKAPAAPFPFTSEDDLRALAGGVDMHCSPGGRFATQFARGAFLMQASVMQAAEQREAVG